MDPLPFGKTATSSISLHIDSRYRDRTRYPNSGHFSLDLNPIIQNVVAIRLSSIELPNVFYTFSDGKKNTTFMINNVEIRIAPGNYTADEMMCQIQKDLDSKFQKGRYEISYSEVTGRVTIIAKDNIIFKLAESKKRSNVLRTQAGEKIPTPSLLHSLGFRQTIYASGRQYTSESIIDIVGPNYLFMRVNDFGSLRYRQYGVSNAFAKIILTSPKSTVSFDNFGNFVSKQHDFHQPVNLSKLLIDLIDPYEEVVDMMGMDYSMTFELISVRDFFVKKQLEQDLIKWQYDETEEDDDEEDGEEENVLS